MTCTATTISFTNRLNTNLINWLANNHNDYGLIGKKVAYFSCESIYSLYNKTFNCYEFSRSTEIIFAPRCIDYCYYIIFENCARQNMNYRRPRISSTMAPEAGLGGAFDKILACMRNALLQRLLAPRRRHVLTSARRPTLCARRLPRLSSR